MKPFIKYLGGKRKLVPFLTPLLPKTYNTYYEPLLGGGAVLFGLQPKKAIINDLQTDLVDSYKIIRDDLPGLLGLLREMHHKNYETNTSDQGAYFYSVRAWDRLPGYETRPALERAARFIFLNRTGFNGLIRVNKSGQSNVPWGKGLEEYQVDEVNLLEVSAYLKNNEIEILNEDVVGVLSKAEPNDLVYLDPPYLAVSETANFTSYSKDGFSYADHLRLRDAIDKATDKGVYIIYSGADNKATRDLFSDPKYTTHSVMMARAINSDGSGRGKIGELVILNYTP